MAPFTVPRLTVPSIYGIADAAALAPRSMAAAAAEWARAGIGWIQLRGKSLSDDELLRQADAALGSVGEAARVWMNDRSDLARMAGCFGVHLGHDDLEPAAARRFLGPDVAIGRSTHDRAQIDAAIADPAVDVVAIGPVFPTSGKQQPAPVVGLELLRWARPRTAKPLVAIGGIDADNAARVLATGVDCVAALGALCQGDLRRAADRLLAAVASS
jgi:thiamine-phosphate pyrophosphorylase